ncbi:MAG: hypothetical protein HKN11_00460, partial [Rhizobiales bacterium]|nr:hypothetical protein [Hyphomicrobiales bacterium]
PGLANWMRVADHRIHMIDKLANIEIYRESELTIADLLELGPGHILLATGSTWRRDGVGHFNHGAVAIDPGFNVVTPDDIFAGTELSGPITIYDDEHYFMGGALAERFVNEGHDVTIITPHNKVSAWTEMTNEHFFIQRRLLKMGVKLVFDRKLTGVTRHQATLSCIYTGRVEPHPYANLVMVTGRMPNTALFHELTSAAADWADAGILSASRIGDCLVPSSIADAVHSAHRAARNVDTPPDNQPVRRERPQARPVERISS